jgi:hypothetical protein
VENGVSELDRDVHEALERAHADQLGKKEDAPRTQYYGQYEPLPDGASWGPLSFLQPPTPWHVLGIGVLLFVIGRLLGRAPLGDPLEWLGIALIVVGVLSLVLLPRSQPKRWRGRLIYLDEGWRARLYRRIYKR